VEALVVVVVVFVLAGFLLPLGRRPTDGGSLYMRCMTNLRQVGLSSILYATDNHERFPWSRDRSETNEFSGPIAGCYEPLRSYLGGNTRVFICPSDSKRSPSTNALQSTNLSYFINLSSRMKGTNQIIAGDRHLATNGVAAGPGRITLSRGVSPGWTGELHRRNNKQGRAVVVFTDGRGELLGEKTKMQAAFDRAGLAEQTLLVP
jgi:hypothetical protein